MIYDLDAIRARLDDPHAVATALGLIDGPRSFRRLSRGMLVRCPAHDERTPSCSLASTGTGVVWHCFGCSAGGGPLELVAAVSRLDARTEFRRVVEIAALMVGVVEGETAPAFTPRPQPPPPPRLDDATFDRLATALANTSPLAAHPDVLEYVDRRRLPRADLFALPRTRSGLDGLRSAAIAAVGAEAWEISGLASEDGEWLFPRHRLVIPWRAADGRVTTIQRRVITDSDAARVGKYVFATRRPPRDPYGVDYTSRLGPGGDVAYVEGALDTVAMRELCRRHGVDRLVLGLPGVSAWSQAWAGLAAGRVAHVAVDVDGAGERAADRMAAELWAAGAIDVVRTVPRDGGDWCDELCRTEIAS